MKRIRQSIWALVVITLAGCGDVVVPEGGVAPAAPADGLVSGGSVNSLYEQLSVGVTGPIDIRFADPSAWNYFTWNAVVSGGAGPYTYQWQLAYDNVSGGLFANVAFATASSLTHGVAGSDGNMHVKVIVNSADGQQAEGNLSVSVSAPAWCNVRRCVQGDP